MFKSVDCQDQAERKVQLSTLLQHGSKPHWKYGIGFKEMELKVKEKSTNGM
jgi:hypothetical protein